MSTKPDYGIDAPGVIRNLLFVGAALLVLSAFVGTVTIGSARIHARLSFLLSSISSALSGLFMLVYSKYGKFSHRERILNRVQWRGDEHVLDVGTGRGLLLIGAAKHLSTGKATGIDVWSARDLSGNSMESTLRNAELEGVREKIELKTEDASKLTFADASFDVVVSNLCLHNIEDSEARKRACREIVRVLKPGGIAVISDYKNICEYAGVFRSEGLNVLRVQTAFLTTFPALYVLTATNPA
jgi:arsenite methyltransferase